jgi:glycosyltransferase involved in cell wall biosynthesis
MNPLVSIVFTSYNHKEYLRQALESLLNQSYSNFELIIIDDCSTDGSQEILKEYASDPRVNLILSEVNSGSYVRSSNYGASFAKGDYILFAQCDDFAEPNQLEVLVTSAEENTTVGVVFSKSNLVDENGVAFSNDLVGRELSFKRHIGKTRIIRGREMRDFLAFSCVIPNLSAALIKRDLYVKVGGLSDEFIVVADWDFWLKLSEKTDFYYLTEALNNFRQHGTTIRSSVKIKTQIVEIFSMFYNHINSFKIEGKEKRKLQAGAGAIWFSYAFENRKMWLKIFLETSQEIKKKESLWMYFLVVGVVKQFKEYFSRKLGVA